MKDSEHLIDNMIHLAPLHKRLHWRIIKWKLALARRWLRKYDPDYSMKDRIDDLMRRRAIAREMGIGPGDPDYPVLNMEVEEKWKTRK